MISNFFTFVLENPDRVIITAVLIIMAFALLYFIGGDSIIFFRRKEQEDAGRNTKKIEPVIKRFANAKGYKVFTDITIANKNATATFDIVLVGAFGVLCINTNGLGGEIYGTAKDDEWLKIFEGERKHFPNPLDENSKNTGVLRSALSERGHKPKFFESLLVFTQGKTEVNAPTSLPYAYPNDMRDFINQPKFTINNKVDIDAVYTAIESLIVPAETLVEIEKETADS